jgi:hypothetical protein
LCHEDSANLVIDAAEAIIANLHTSSPNSRTASRPAPSTQTTSPPVTKSVKQNVSGGYINLRRGPGQQYEPPIVEIPAGTTGLVVGSCVASTDGVSKYPWCSVKWNNYQGWASSNGLE